MEYNAYDELMSYFQFEINIYIMLVIIIVVGVIKSIVIYIELKKVDYNSYIPKCNKLYDLAVSFLAILGLANAMFFQGVISDIPMESGYVWINKSIYLFITALVLFNMQIIFMVMTDMKIRRLKRSFNNC